MGRTCVGNRNDLCDGNCSSAAKENFIKRTRRIAAICWIAQLDEKAPAYCRNIAIALKTPDRAAGLSFGLHIADTISTLSLLAAEEQ